jgi:hypothetical protein
MATDFNLGWVDHSDERSSTNFRVQEAAGDDFTTAIATAQTVADALAVVSLCNRVNLTMSKMLESDTPIIPSAVYAQRESAIKVFYVDDVNGRKFTLTIPGPDLELLAIAPGTDNIDITTALAPGTVLKAALDSTLCSEDGNTITVYRMKYVGRAS